MSRAFDTINREKLMSELENIFDEDCLRLIQVLLEKTTLQARIKNALSQPFNTTIGAPQGDSLSPVLFTIYLELAMREIRNAVPRPPEDEEIPGEIIYADDTDYISTSREYLETIEAEASRILGDWNLTVNASKVEKTVLYRKEEKEKEEWRKVKKLGTLLGDSEEAKRRKQLASAAFQKLKNIWSNKTKNKAQRIRLYETYTVVAINK